MNINFRKGAMVVVLLLLGVLVVSFSKQYFLSAPAERPSDSSSSGIARQVEPVRRQVTENKYRRSKVPNNQGRPSIDDQIAATLEAANVPIEFWGKVIDHESRPLTEVHIKGRVRQWKAPFSLQGYAGFSTVDTKTDDNGLFHISGQSGDLLSIESITREGYQLEPAAKKFFGFNTSEQFRSDPGSPIAFRMWPSDIHEELLTGKKSFHISIDGKPFEIDLKSGAIVEAGKGHLRVSINHQAGANPAQTYAWSAQIEALDGGLCEETNSNSSMYLAPETGYNPIFLHDQMIKGGQRGSTGTRRFFVMLNDGPIYGRITVEMFAPYNNRIPGFIQMTYAINPSGSRTLR